MLHWFEGDNSSNEIRAPLVLIPVTLQRISAREKFKLSYNDEDLEDNLSLATKLATEFQVNFPEMPEADDLDVDAYFKAVAKAIRGQDRWRVERNEITLGMFSFGKFLMYRDLEPEHWCSEENPDGSPTLAALLRDGFGADDSVVSEDEYLDERIEPDGRVAVIWATSFMLLNSGPSNSRPRRTAVSTTPDEKVAKSVSSHSLSACPLPGERMPRPEPKPVTVRVPSVCGSTAEKVTVVAP